MTAKPTPTRPARPDETCICGNPATVVWLLDDLGPTPWCGHTHGDQRREDCPPWCTESHVAPFDREHAGDVYGVELDAHPYQVRTAYTGGEWETYRHSILAAISKDSADRPAYIGIVGQDEKPVSHLTAYEADQLAEILHQLAATLRASEEGR